MSTQKAFPVAASTVERGYFPLEALRAMKPLTSAKRKPAAKHPEHRDQNDQKTSPLTPGRSADGADAPRPAGAPQAPGGPGLNEEKPAAPTAAAGKASRPKAAALTTREKIRAAFWKEAQPGIAQLRRKNVPAERQDSLARTAFEHWIVGVQQAGRVPADLAATATL